MNAEQGRSRAFPRQDAAARRALTRRRRRRKVRMGVAWTALGLLGVSAGLALTLGWNTGLEYLRTHTSLFEARQVDVSATAWVAPWEVVELSGIAPGDDLLEVIPDSVAARLRAHPRIADARVTRTWRRSVWLWVDEVPPVALLMQGTGFEVAADGTVLGPPPKSARPEWPAPERGGWSPRGVDLPLLTGLSAQKVAPGQVLQPPAVRQALDFLLRLEAYGEDGHGWLSEVWAGAPGELEAVTLSGIRVRVGDGRLGPRKLAALHTVLARIEQEEEPVRYVDARFRNQVIVKRG